MVSVSAFLLAASALHVMWGDEELDLGRTTAEKRVHRMAYAGDVMKFDRPWEGDGCGYFHVVEDVRGRVPKTASCPHATGLKILNSPILPADGGGK